MRRGREGRGERRRRTRFSSSLPVNTLIDLLCRKAKRIKFAEKGWLCKNRAVNIFTWQILPALTLLSRLFYFTTDSIPPIHTRLLHELDVELLVTEWEKAGHKLAVNKNEAISSVLKRMEEKESKGFLLKKEA